MRPNASAHQHAAEPGVHRRDGERRGLVADDVDAHDRRGDLAVAHAWPARGPGGCGRGCARTRSTTADQDERRGTRAARAARTGRRGSPGVGVRSENAKPNRLNGCDGDALVAAGDRRGVLEDVLAEEHQPERGEAEVDAAHAAGDRAEQRARQAGQRDGADQREQRRSRAGGRPAGTSCPPGTRSRRRRWRRRTRAPSDSWPAMPTSRVSPIAAIIAAIANSAVCSQKLSR